uniref:Bm13406 n=1 Tax=Brugia malayi TaxID=6279 RepID=A0A1I9G0T8_BRUMA|nr:Bm13406 [Brugia malayi]
MTIVSVIDWDGWIILFHSLRSFINLLNYSIHSLIDN